MYDRIIHTAILPNPCRVGCIKLGEEGKFIGYLNCLGAHEVDDIEQVSLERRNEATLVSGFIALDANGDVKGMACLDLPKHPYGTSPHLYVVRNMAVDGMMLAQYRDGDEFRYRDRRKVTVEDIPWDNGISEWIEYQNGLVMRRGCKNTKTLLKSARKILLPMLRNVM